MPDRPGHVRLRETRRPLDKSHRGLLRLEEPTCRLGNGQPHQGRTYSILPTVGVPCGATAFHCFQRGLGKQAVPCILVPLGATKDSQF